MNNLSRQYNDFAENFSQQQSADYNYVSKKHFYRTVGKLRAGAKVLDLGCGDATDLRYLSKYKICPFGLDASKKMIDPAKRIMSTATITLGVFEKIPFNAYSFDHVISKYALQTSQDIERIYREVNRVLKKSGSFTFLVAHPTRHFMEKRKKGKNYFQQEIVNSPILFAKKIIVREPSHTFNEYLSPYFLQHFDVISFTEAADPTVEQIGGDLYPGFVVIKAIKR